MVRVKKREEPTPTDEANAAAARYVHLKSEIKERSAEAEKLKATLMGFLSDNGEEDDQGSLWHYLPNPVEGITAVKRERRQTVGLDADRTLSILQKKGLDKRCYRMEPVLDQDAVMSAVSEGLISEDELAEMFPPKVTWALVTNKG